MPTAKEHREIVQRNSITCPHCTQLVTLCVSDILTDTTRKLLSDLMRDGLVELRPIEAVLEDAIEQDRDIWSDAVEEGSDD